MDSEDEVSITEPQLTYWNPQYRSHGSLPSLPEIILEPIGPIQFLAINTADPAIGEVSQINTFNANCFDNQLLLTQEIVNPNPATGDSMNSVIIPESNINFDLEIMQSMRRESSSIVPSSSKVTESASNNQEEIVKAAKSLFGKRTRTLYNCMYPGQSKTKLKSIVSNAWEILPQEEKHFYMSQVLGRFGLQASNLMVNPQLGGIKGWSIECKETSDNKETVTQNHDDKNNGSKRKTKSVKSNKLASRPRRKYRRSTTKKEKEEEEEEEKEEEDDELVYRSNFKDQEAVALQKLKDIQEKLNLHCFDEDPELTRELEEFQMLTEDQERNLWDEMPEPDELFVNFDF